MAPTDPPLDLATEPLALPHEARRPRRGATAFVAVVALLAGGLGGFAGGRLSAPDADGSTIASVADGAGDAAATDPADSPGELRTDAGASSSMAVSGSMAPSDSSGPGYQPPAARRLFKRTVAGVELRVSAYDQTTNGCKGAGCPPAACRSTVAYGVAVVGEWDVGSGGGMPYGPLTQPMRVAGQIYVGEASPAASMRLGLVIEARDDVRTVRWVGADGAVRDQMAPDHGVVALMAEVGVDPNRGPADDGSNLEAVGDGGRVLLRVPANAFVDDGSSMPAECRGGGGDPMTTAVPVQPQGPQLPAAGEQPADRAKAEAAVRATFAVALGNAGDPAAANAAIDDPEGLQEARDASRKAYPQFADRASFVLDELVFTSPTRAAFRYRVLNTDNDSVLANQIGTARLVGDRWLVTRTTVCTLLPVKPAGC